jgi:magnesium chelatase accessory protein
MNDAPTWDRDGRDWPNRAASRFVAAGGLRWHVQVMGGGPPLLLLHGTGAATHSWRDLLPLLAQRFTVVAPDLPGHGFTTPPAGYRPTLPRVAEDVHALLVALKVRPRVALGHSAGAAILARMSLDHHLDLAHLVSLNGALLPLRGLPGHVFSPAAKLLAVNPLAPRLFAWRAADPAAVARLIASTGSVLTPEGEELYARLVRKPGHVRGALTMMANWDLRPLARDLSQLRPQLWLVVGGNDRTVPPAEALRVQALLPGAKIKRLARLGHLAHEERPREIADFVFALPAPA